MMPKKPPFESTVSANTGFGQAGASGSSGAEAKEAKSPEGTSIAKYHPTTPTIARQKINALQKRHCITTMKSYSDKSLEELRMEDYMAGRKGGGDGIKCEDKMKLVEDIRVICEKIKNLEAHCETMKEENVALKAQIADLMNRGMNVQDQKPEQSLSNEETHKNQGRRKMIALDNIPGSLSIAPKKFNKPSPTANAGSSHLSLQQSGKIRKVVGQAVNPDPLPTVQMKRWLFVTRFANTVTEDNICDYMARKLSTKRRPDRCIKLPRYDGRPSNIASFRVELLLEDFEQALDPNFWDKGVLVSEFRFPNKRNNSRNSARSARLDASF